MYTHILKGLHGGTLALLLCSKKILDLILGQGSFCVMFAFSNHLPIGSVQVQQLPSTVQISDCKMNCSVNDGLSYQCVCMFICPVCLCVARW